MRKRQQVIDHIANQKFDVCIIGGGATGSACALESQLRGLNTVMLDAGDFAPAVPRHPPKWRTAASVISRKPSPISTSTNITWWKRRYGNAGSCCTTRPSHPHAGIPGSLLQLLRPLLLRPRHEDIRLDFGKSQPAPQPLAHPQGGPLPHARHAVEYLAGAVSYADGQFDDGRYCVALVDTFDGLGGWALNYARVTALEKNPEGKIMAAVVTDQVSERSFQIMASALVNATGPFSDVMRNLASAEAGSRMRPSKGVHILFPLDGFSENDALLVPRTEDGRVIFAVPWNGRLLVGTTDTGYKPGEEMVVTREEIEYLLRQLNPYLSSPLRADQVVSGYAGVRPLVAAQGVTETKKLIRDDELEVDAKSGLISILGGKWTTHRLMGQETIDKVQESIGEEVTLSPTIDHPLSGAADYKWDYWETLAVQFKLPVATAKHLAHKYGTRAPDVLKLVDADPSLALPLVQGEAPIRAQVSYAVRHEMAQTMEDVLARRIGLQLYGWGLEIQAAPAVAEVLRKELGWSEHEELAALEEYAAKVNHMLTSAGLEPVAVAAGLVAGRS